MAHQWISSREHKITLVAQISGMWLNLLDQIRTRKLVFVSFHLTNTIESCLQEMTE